MREVPWCHARSIADYCACLRLYFEGSLCWSPFGSFSVLRDDTLPLLPALIRCSKLGMLSFDSQGGRDCEPVKNSTFATHVAQREYVRFLIWKSQQLPEYIHVLRNQGFVVYVNDDVQEEVMLTRGKINDEWRPLTSDKLDDSHDIRHAVDDVFSFATPALRHSAYDNVVEVFAYDPVWGRRTLVDIMAEVAEQTLPALQPSALEAKWTTARPVKCPSFMT